MDLFSTPTTCIKLEMPDAEVHYYPYFLSKKESDLFFEQLLSNTPWQQDHIKIFGKTYQQPRLTALYGNNQKEYSYSNITMQPHLFTEPLMKIKTKVEKCSNIFFTSCLLNLYRDGKDSNGWHADDEKELGKNPPIASVTFGEKRWFHFKHKTKNIKQKIQLEHGSLLLMTGSTQHNWLHQISKSTKITKPRINLTFRNIL